VRAPTGAWCKSTPIAAGSATRLQRILNHSATGMVDPWCGRSDSVPQRHEIILNASAHHPESASSPRTDRSSPTSHRFRRPGSTRIQSKSTGPRRVFGLLCARSVNRVLHALLVVSVATVITAQPNPRVVRVGVACSLPAKRHRRPEEPRVLQDTPRRQPAVDVCRLHCHGERCPPRSS
jgi:hypothetical protein